MPVTQRVGVFGGTFDPPHVGHLVAARNAAHILGLDRVLFVVANVPWQKVGTRDISPVEDRLAMARATAARRPEFECSDLEVRRGGDSETAATLVALADELPGTELVVIVGSDAAAGMGTWRDPEVIAERATIAVVDRPGAAGGRPPAGFRTVVVPCPLMDISSSDIRDRVRRGDPIDFLVADDVGAYIRVSGLYAGVRPSP